MSAYSNLHKTDASVLSIDKAKKQNPVEIGTVRAAECVSDKPNSSQINNKPDASISLMFAKESGTSRLVSRDHFGQLYVQKPFYPEGPEVCHIVLVHPPGGVVGGDRLEIANHVGADAKVQITTPGAAKWYRANGRISHQNVTLDVKAGGAMEWLPQETIFFNEADVNLVHNVNLENNATYIGCEIFCLGRTAFGESFNMGRIRQSVNIRRDNQLIWYEQLNLLGGGKAMENPLILAGKTVCATLIAAGPEAHNGDLIDTLRDQVSAITEDSGLLGVSQVNSIVVARYLGDSSEVARAVMLKVWDVLRPTLLGRKAEVPRMWNT